MVDTAPAVQASGPEFIDVVEEVEQQFSALYVNAYRGLRRRAASVHPQLVTTGFRLLNLLFLRGSLQQVEIAEVLELDKAVVSRTVKQLGELGLVGCSPDPHDGRASRVALTAEAQDRLQAVNDLERTALESRLAGWRTEEVRQLAQFLLRLNETI